MPEMVVTVAQVNGTPTSAGSARDHQVLIDRPQNKGGLDTLGAGTRLTIRRA
jgi:hypothetical protein